MDYSKPAAFIIPLMERRCPVLQRKGSYISSYIADIPVSLAAEIRLWPIEFVSELYLKIAQVTHKSLQHLSGIVEKAHKVSLAGKPLIILIHPEIIDFISYQYINLLETDAYRDEPKKLCIVSDILTETGGGGVKVTQILGPEHLN